MTIDLPIIRTSVEYGTAFREAGKGTASPRGLILAIWPASAMCAAQATDSWLGQDELSTEELPLSSNQPINSYHQCSVPVCEIWPNGMVVPVALAIIRPS